jgi:DNA polymerase I-like protein with 3'-5' exonuclease and polymerase domains
MKEVSYGPTANKIAQNVGETPAFELPKNNVVTYTVTGNDVCPRGIFPGVITEAFSEPHATEEFSVAVVLIDAETPDGVQKLRMRIPLKTGHRIHRLRLHSGESIESLRAELLNGTNGTANTTQFDLNKLHGRNLVVQVRDDEFNNVKFTRVAPLTRTCPASQEKQSSPKRLPPPDLMYAFDIESYYDKELNVRELGAFNYLARTDVYLVSFWGPDGGWVGHPSDVDWRWFKGSELWSHNRAFDGAFLAARGLPDPGGNCTSNLAAYFCGHHNLKDAAKALLNVDVSKEVRAQMEGVQWADLSPERQQDFRDYTLRDAELSYVLATQFRDRWPEKEQRLSTHTINMCQRGIAVDLGYLARCKTRAQEIQAEAIKLIPWAGQFDEKGKEKKLLSANEMRAECARLGIPAPANFDASKAALRNWEARYGGAYPFVAAVRAYRRATIKQKKLEAIERRIMPDGRMYYDLRYMGAPHTGRWTSKSRDSHGGDESGVNLQNLDRDAFEDIELRRLFVPKSGHVFIACDLSAIEPRLLAWYTQDNDLLRLLKQGYGVYEAQARAWDMWKDPRPLKETDHTLYQQVKTFALGCGYQMGAARFRDNIEDKLGIKYTEDQAKELIQTYRTKNPGVVRFWNALNSDVQDAFLNHADRALNVNLPSGRSIRYFDIRANPNSKRTWGRDLIADVGGVKQVRVYGGSLTENMIQATGRDVFAEAVLRLEQAGYVPVLSIHDEVVVEAPVGTDPQKVVDIMAAPVPWLPGLNLGAEAQVLTHYKK